MRIVVFLNSILLLKKRMLFNKRKILLKLPTNKNLQKNKTPQSSKRNLQLRPIIEKFQWIKNPQFLKIRPKKSLNLTMGQLEKLPLIARLREKRNQLNNLLNNKNNKLWKWLLTKLVKLLHLLEKAPKKWKKLPPKKMKHHLNNHQRKFKLRRKLFQEKFCLN